MRKLGFLVAPLTVVALIGVPAAVGSAAAGAQTQPTPEVTAFCDAALKVDSALNKVFSTKKPSSKLKQEADQTLAQAESTAPPDIAATVQSVVGTIRNAIQSGQNPEQLFRDPTLEADSQAIDAYRYNSCGYNQVEVTGIEYEFQGLPKTLPPGKTAFKLTDDGTELHMLDLFRIKTKDSLKKLLGMSEKEAMKKTEEVGSADVTTIGGSAYFVTDLKPGRYGAVCFFPVGATDLSKLENAKGQPHWKKGMYQEVKVQAGSTTTSAG